MAAMGRTSMKRVSLKQEGFEIELERECASDVVIAHPRPVAPILPKDIPQQNHQEVKQEAPPSGDFVKSPMVGTFYSSPSPEDPPFIKVGDVVDEGSVLCIIEAMKVMNEVKSGIKGKIVEVLVQNGDPVEFGSHMFRIES